MSDYGAVAGGASTLSLSPEVRPANWPAVRHRKGAFALADTARRWVDYESGLLSVLLGHAHHEVTEAVSFAAAGRVASEQGVAEATRRLAGYPDGQVRFTATGTHACEAAVRIARAATGRDLVLSIGYHGWADSVLTAAPGWGVPKTVRALTRTAPWGDLAAAEGAFFGLDPDGRGGIRVGAEDPTIAGAYLACVIVEPATLQSPPAGYLEGLAAVCKRFGALLIFDECITGGRYEKFTLGHTAGVLPDLTVLSKGLANGAPLGAVVGPRDLLRCFDKDYRPAGAKTEATGPVYVSGTWSAPGLSLAASEATLRVWEREDAWARIDQAGRDLWSGLHALASGVAGGRIRLEGHPYRLALTVRKSGGTGVNWEGLTLLRQLAVEEGLLLGTGFNVTMAHDDTAVLGRTLDAWGRTVDRWAAVPEGEEAPHLIGGHVCVPPYRQA